ncbi:MAG: S-layer homology domain-containing protein [Anaerovoracaceae bacterium]
MKRNRKFTAAVLAVMVIMSSFSGFTYYDGIGNVYLDSEKKIFDGAVYREQIAVNSSNGAEKAYFVEAETGGKLEAMVFNGEVRSTATVGTMIKYAEEQGYKVLAAINGDIYDTSTGTPKGLVIHNGNIVTSGYNPDRVIAFDNNGKASMQYVNLSYGLKGTLAYDDVKETDVIDANGNPTGEKTTQTVKVETGFKNNINFVNVPHGASNGLHLYNRHYATSTKTAGSCIEVVVDCGSTDNIQLQVGKTIKGTVKSVNVDTHNTPIGENEIVLSTVSGSATASQLYCMVVGSEVEISVTDNNNNLSNVKEAIGFYYSLLEGGNVVTSGTGLNPRTAVGIKADGSLVLYAVDGRQTASKGLNLVQLANHMKALGCEYAFNMDGGGSTVLYSRLPGIETTAVRKNVPSDSSERKVSNAILLVYKGNGGSSAANLNLYPAMTLLMPGASVQINSYASNELFEKTAMTGSVNYEVKDGEGSITSNGLYTAGDKEGVETIVGTSGNISGETKVQVVKSGLTLTPSVTKLYLNANESSDINISVKSGPINVVSNDSIFTWSCDENIGTIDSNGLFKAGSKNAETGNIYVKYGDYNITIPVQVGQTSIDFADTADHWARTYIGSLAARGIANGMGDNLYMPDAQLTRAQFLAFLAKTMDGTDVTKSAPAGFTDVPENEWYYNYVNWGYENGIVSGMGDGIFEPNANITREQMCIMLCKFAASQELQLPQNSEAKTFTDQNAISPWASDYVNTIVRAGIINGQPEGDFQPQGLATRAQAAKVVYVYLDIKAGIQQ